MIETLIYEYLSELFNAYMEVPESPPDEYIIIERTGGTVSNHINSCIIVIQSYAPSMYRAAALNEDVKDAMNNLTQLDEVSSCQLNSDYNYTNTVTHQYRYQAVYDVFFMLGG